VKVKLLSLKKFLLDIIFPPICVSCQVYLKENEKNKSICGACLAESVVNTTLFCPICRARLPENKKTCHKKARYLLGAAASYSNSAVRRLIWKLKYKKQEAAAAAAAEILFRYINNLEFDFSKFIIVPVPLHRIRLRKRGFNQTELIADVLGKKINIAVFKNALIKKRHTPPQVEMPDQDKRKENVKDCFAIKNLLDVANRNIIILDDVSTSGATLDEIARLLKGSGARKIIGLVLAKAR